MCISLISTGLMVAASAAGAAMTAMGAQQQAKQVKQQMEVQNAQLKQEQDMTRLKAQQQEAERLNQVQQMTSRNQAYLAGSGVEESQSFLQGVEPFNRRQLSADLTTLNLGQKYQTSRIADQITVNNMQTAFASQKAGYETAGGLIKAAGSIAGDVRSRYNATSYYGIGKT